MSVKSSISLTNQQDAFVRELVRQGRYSSVSAVLQQGLDLLRKQMEAQEAETQALRVLVEQRRGGGSVPANRMQDGLARMLNRKKRQHGVAD